MSHYGPRPDHGALLDDGHLRRNGYATSREVVVGESDIWPNEDVILQPNSIPDLYTILHGDAVPDNDIIFFEDAVADVAVHADDGSGENMSECPDASAAANP